MFFADDSSLFSRANPYEANRILQILCLYEEASGQKVNSERWSSLLAEMFQKWFCKVIQSRVRVKAVDHHEKYLALPPLIGRSKKLVFSMVRDEVLEKLKGLEGKGYPLPEKKFLSKLWYSQFPHTSWAAFSFPSFCVMN